MGMLAASGRNMRVIATASAETGALCNLITLEQWSDKGFPKSARDVQKLTAGHKCCHPELPCSKRHSSDCAITVDDVVKNLTKMANKAILQLDDTERVVKLY